MFFSRESFRDLLFDNSRSIMHDNGQSQRGNWSGRFSSTARSQAGQHLPPVQKSCPHPPPGIPHTRTLVRTSMHQVLLQRRRWMQTEASLEQRRGGKARPGCPLLPPCAPRAGPGAAPGDAPVGTALPDALHRSSPTHPLASPLCVPGRPPGPTSGRVPVSAAPAGPPRPALGAAGAAGRAGGGGCRGEERRRHVTASRASPAHRRAVPLPPRRPRPPGAAATRREEEPPRRAEPGRAVFTNSPGTRPDRTLKAGSPAGFRHLSREPR